MVLQVVILVMFGSCVMTTAADVMDQLNTMMDSLQLIELRFNESDAVTRRYLRQITRIWLEESQSTHAEIRKDCYQIGCPPDYLYDNTARICLKIFVDRNFRWTRARRDCVERGGDLAVLDTQGKFDAAVSYLQRLVNKSPDFWSGDKVIFLGGTDVDHEGIWNWTNQNPVAASLWGEGQPHNNNNEDCLVLSKAAYKLRVALCGLETLYMCEIPITTEGVPRDS